ncbi:MAG: metallophosphoesterase family protein [Caldilineaceae bacterium]|nr:metallophosphoesterase family protein [Caldilineaceae bacterium]MCB0142014.1 metallophosphoesterase family protein [Caldilineaceae bacterium]
MKIALISDIHGNLHSLERVLNAIDTEAPDQIICLGDVAATGPQPSQCVALLRDRNIPCVMGNADAWLLEPAPDANANAFMRFVEEIDLWCAAQFTPQDIAYLRAAQPTIEVALPGHNPLLCYHGSPQSFNDGIRPTTLEEELAPWLEGSAAQIYAGGHTHQQMLRRYCDAIILNPGSVGMAYELDRQTGEARNVGWAEYAMIDAAKSGQLQIDLRRLPVEVNIIVQNALASGMPRAEEWAEHWPK